MQIPRPLRYIAAIDVIEKAHVREAAVYFERNLDPNTSLPLDAGVQGAAEVYGIRGIGILRTAGAIALRLTGIDAVARAVADIGFPH